MILRLFILIDMVPHNLQGVIISYFIFKSLLGDTQKPNEIKDTDNSVSFGFKACNTWPGGGVTLIALYCFFNVWLFHCAIIFSTYIAMATFIHRRTCLNPQLLPGHPGIVYQKQRFVCDMNASFNVIFQDAIKKIFISTAFARYCIDCSTTC